MTGSAGKLTVPATLGRVSFVLVVGMTAMYVGCFEAAYRSNAACREAAQWTRVVVDPSLSAKNLIAIGSNAGYVIVVSDEDCELGEMDDGTGVHRFLLDLWRPPSGRVRFLWRRLPWSAALSEKSAGREELPPAMVVPLSRVLCMYDEPANGADASSLCTARTSETSNDSPVPPQKAELDAQPSTTPEEPDANSPRLEERLITEIRNKLEEKNDRCDDLRISPPIVFRPRVSDEPAAPTGPDSVEHAVRSLRLDDADRAELYVFGYASADGPRNYNQTLSEQRAAQVVREVVRQTGRQVAGRFPMGEDHLVNGVAESRGARLVACVPPQ